MRCPLCAQTFDEEGYMYHERYTFPISVTNTVSACQWLCFNPQEISQYLIEHWKKGEAIIYDAFIRDGTLVLADADMDFSVCHRTPFFKLCAVYAWIRFHQFAIPRSVYHSMDIDARNGWIDRKMGLSGIGMNRHLLEYEVMLDDLYFIRKV